MRHWNGEFYTYDGRRYRVTPNNELRERLIKDLDNWFSHLTREAVSNVLACIEAECLLPSQTLMPSWLDDQVAWNAAECLVCTNGILPLRSLDTKPTLIAPTPALFTVNGLGFAFDPKAACPQWLAFLSQLWPDDQADHVEEREPMRSIDVLQEIMGYVLLPETRFQKMFMLIGPRRSGKGTIARVIKQIVGPDNVCSPRLGSLAGDFGLQPLLRKTVAIIGDVRLSRRIDSAAIVETLLGITGEDPQTVNRKHLTAVDGHLPVRCLLLSNELPNLNDASATLPSRMILLRLRESLYGREDHDLTEKPTTEPPGILNVAV